LGFLVQGVPIFHFYNKDDKLMKRLMLIMTSLLLPRLLESQTTRFEQEFNRGDLTRDWTVLGIETGQPINPTP
jgi:hypothetical protein